MTSIIFGKIAIGLAEGQRSYITPRLITPT